MTETGLREEICRLGRSLFERGLTPGSSGNISVRLDDGGWLVTPTNASLGSLDPARLSRLDADGRLMSGDAPTKEVPLHTALYQTRSTARAVVHLHSTHSVALSMLPEIDPRAALPPMTAYYLMKCGATALVPYYRPGDPAVADAIKGLAGKYSSVLLANHGPVVSGETLEAAVFAIEELEETAKLYLLLRGLNPRYLTPAQVADLSKTFGLTLPEHGHDRMSEPSHAASVRSIEHEHATIRAPPAACSCRSVTSINPGACVIANGSFAAAITACGVTPQAQNTGISSASTGTGSP